MTIDIINYSRKDIRRVDFTFSIGYTADFALAQKIILSIFAKSSSREFKVITG